MKFLRLCLVFAGIAAATCLVRAQDAQPSSTVEKRTYEKDGKTVTERVITTRVTDVAVKPSVYTAAIFVSNRAGKEHDDKIASLEDYITSGVTDKGVSVISRETALNAVQGLDADAKANALDQELAQSSSAVRLAQTLGADYLLQVSLSSVGSKKNSVNAYGVKTTNNEQTVRVSYKILDGTTGASLTADTVRASRMVQGTANVSEDSSDVLNELLDEAAGKVAASLQSRIERGRIAAPAAGGGLVNVTIAVEVADLVIPDVRIGVENTVAISDSKFKVAPMGTTVEVDGLAIGSAPGTFEVKPGLHKLRVTREGFQPWERTVNFTRDMTLNVAIQMSAAGFARWQEATQFLNDLKNGAKLTDAEVRRLEGEAKMLEQSGFRVDTKEGVTIKRNSIFGD
ncbi:MAG TPA: PEGA domain-containing protein [Opitutus sp.]|nr:PEGA domain-containing protein [Opitutus sp.]